MLVAEDLTAECCTGPDKVAMLQIPFEPCIYLSKSGSSRGHLAEAAVQVEWTILQDRQGTC